MKVMIDTNVVLDSIGSRAPFDKAAQEIFLLAARKKITAAITASTASDIYYLMKKRLQSGEQAAEALKKVFAIFDVVSVDRSDCMKAFDTGMSDYEDSLLAVCASRSKANYIVTRNIKDFKGSPVQEITPDEFLEKFSL